MRRAYCLHTYTRNSRPWLPGRKRRSPRQRNLFGEQAGHRAFWQARFCVSTSRSSPAYRFSCITSELPLGHKNNLRVIDALIFSRHGRNAVVCAVAGEPGELPVIEWTTALKDDRIRCPYCVLDGQFMLMMRQTDSDWFFCNGCGHLSLPIAPMYGAHAGNAHRSTATRDAHRLRARFVFDCRACSSAFG